MLYDHFLNLQWRRPLIVQKYVQNENCANVCGCQLNIIPGRPSSIKIWPSIGIFSYSAKVYVHSAFCSFIHSKNIKSQLSLNNIYQVWLTWDTNLGLQSVSPLLNPVTTTSSLEGLLLFHARSPDYLSCKSYISHVQSKTPWHKKRLALTNTAGLKLWDRNIIYL